MEDQNTENAVRFFHAVFGGRPSDIDELAGDDVVVTYPIFQRLLSKPTVRGREELIAFATRFSTTWTDARITVEETIAQGNSVVLMWTFTARNTGPGATGDPPSNKEASWGGLSLYRFDEHGKITTEIGEESFPGPAARLQA